MSLVSRRLHSVKRQSTCLRQASDTERPTTGRKAILKPVETRETSTTLVFLWWRACRLRHWKKRFDIPQPARHGTSPSDWRTRLPLQESSTHECHRVARAFGLGSSAKFRQNEPNFQNRNSVLVIRVICGCFEAQELMNTVRQVANRNHRG